MQAASLYLEDPGVIDLRRRKTAANSIRLLRVVVASPGDVQAERKSVAGVLKKLNMTVAADRKVRLEAALWETETYPGFHVDGPQGLIDSLLKIEDADLLIGIFWTRFGTPVYDADSGTEHEILRAYEHWEKDGRPQIMVYRSEKTCKLKTPPS